MSDTRPAAISRSERSRRGDAAGHQVGEALVGRGEPAEPTPGPPGWPACPQPWKRTMGRSGSPSSRRAAARSLGRDGAEVAGVDPVRHHDRARRVGAESDRRTRPGRARSPSSRDRHARRHDARPADVPKPRRRPGGRRPLTASAHERNLSVSTFAAAYTQGVPRRRQRPGEPELPRVVDHDDVGPAEVRRHRARARPLASRGPRGAGRSCQNRPLVHITIDPSGWVRRSSDCESLTEYSLIARRLRGCSSGDRQMANVVAAAQLAPECRDPNRHPAPRWENTGAGLHRALARAATLPADPCRT